MFQTWHLFRNAFVPSFATYSVSLTKATAAARRGIAGSDANFTVNTHRQKVHSRFPGYPTTFNFLDESFSALAPGL